VARPGPQLHLRRRARVVSFYSESIIMKPIFLVDMDGPLAGFDEHFFAQCAANGWPLDVEGPHAQTARFATDHIPDREHRRLARALVDDTDWFRELPVTPYAVEGMMHLEAYGWDVWVCTKPLEVNKTCRDSKAAWLEEHFPGYERKLIITPDKSMVHGAILLDDAPHIDWIRRAEWAPVIFDAPYNRDGSKWEGLSRTTWEEILTNSKRWKP
jgi:5'-nucleotidase